MALAEMYETGEGVAQCDEKATYHYIEAANRMHNAAKWKAATLRSSHPVLVFRCTSIRRSTFSTWQQGVGTFLLNARQVNYT